jgi:hypothetical protein
MNKKATRTASVGVIAPAKKAKKTAALSSRVAISSSTAIVPALHVERAILSIRGHRVMLDETLAELYGVPVRRLNEQVKRNIERFPEDFMFQLTEDEVTNLRSQSAISSGHGGRRFRPYAFTEYGVAMLSSVLRSERAVQVNIEIMRTFGRLRTMLQEHAALAKKLATLERKYDAQFKVVFDAIRELMQPPAKAKRPIGFKSGTP